MTLFVQLKILEKSVDKKCKFVILSQNRGGKKKKSPNPAIVPEGVL